MTDVEKLLAIEEIRQLKARYFRSIDTKDFDNLRTVFAPDAVFDFREALRDPVKGTPEGVAEHEPVAGLEEIVAYIRSALTGAQSAHHGHTPEIEILSDTEARGIHPMEDTVMNGTLFFRGYGHYRETYRKVNGHWRIQTSQLTRLIVRVESL
ncbi:MAG: nuclear transport factor 2 family protein [Alphaproteobacteria bacterium]|nr:nuclear transport factor 2 family protein [Alphaproteobacteria bacterium]